MDYNTKTKKRAQTITNIAKARIFQVINYIIYIHILSNIFKLWI